MCPGRDEARQSKPPEQQRGSVTGDAVPHGRSGGVPPIGPVIRRGLWLVRFPRERSLSLGTPGLHDASPLGLEETVPYEKSDGQTLRAASNIFTVS
jgi:hypothetical protein